MIRIKRLELIAFGRFENKIIELADGMNLLYGTNEAGKSTIQLFLRTMLYGIKKQGGKKAAKDRDRIIPWNKTAAKGRMILEKDGMDIEICREFGKTARGDKLKVTDPASGEDLFTAAPSDEDVGYRLFKMSRGMFERTVWISQGGIKTESGDDELVARLTKMLEGSGEDEVSAKDAIDVLDKRCAEIKAKNRRYKPGKIDKLEEERRKLFAEREEITAAIRRSEADRKKADDLRAALPEFARRQNDLDEIEKSEYARAAIKRGERLRDHARCMNDIRTDENYCLFTDKLRDISPSDIETADAAAAESEQKAKEAEDKYRTECRAADEENAKTARHKKAAIITAAVLAIVSLAAAAIIQNTMAWAVCAPIAAAVIIAALIYAKHGKPVSVDPTEFEQARQSAEETADTLAAVLGEFNCETVKEFDKKYALYYRRSAKLELIENAYKEDLGGDELQKVLDTAEEQKRYVRPERMDISEIAMNRGRLAQRESDARVALAECETRLKNACGSSAVSDIDGGIALIDEKASRLAEEYEAYKLARDVIADADRKIRSDYTPLLNKKTEEYLRLLTDGGHSAVRVAEDLSVKLDESGDGSEPKSAELFSFGTYNQIYLALRMASAALTVPPKDTVLFLDDVMTAFDDERAERALRLLHKISADGAQVLMFTCHGRDKTNAKKITDINILEV